MSDLPPSHDAEGPDVPPPPGPPPPPPGGSSPPQPSPPGEGWGAPPPPPQQGWAGRYDAGYRPGYGVGYGPSGPRATFGTRLLAFLIDWILLGAINGALQALLRGSLVPAFGLIVGFAYYGFFEGGPAGQTVGKRVVGIRVIRYDTGGELGWATALLRNLCRAISAIPCFLGYLWMLWDREKMTWHDKLSTTVVVPADAYPPPPDSFAKPPRG